SNATTALMIAVYATLHRMRAISSATRIPAVDRLMVDGRLANRSCYKDGSGGPNTGRRASPGAESMTQAIPFEQETEAPIGRTETLTPLVRRLVAPNGGPFTYRGTCSYIVGRGRVAIIDPGPDDATHVAGLLDAVRGETVTHI